jgi:hypothetical protein
MALRIKASNSGFVEGKDWVLSSWRVFSVFTTLTFPSPFDLIDTVPTASEGTYTDGATQVFTRDGRTTYTENGGPTFGQWGVDDQGQFWSFWPPTYRATYEVSWITDADGDVVGIRFTELNRGATSEGRYTPKLT